MENQYTPWEEEGLTEIDWWKRMYLHQSKIAQSYEQAMRDAVLNIKTSRIGVPLIFGALTMLESALDKDYTTL